MTDAPTTIKVVVYHGSYGCDTGCCGHYVELADDAGIDEWTTFNHLSDWTFDHPSAHYGKDFRAWALEFAQDAVTARYGPDHVADLDWDNSIIVDD